MDIYHNIIRPLVTEKSSHQAGGSTTEHGGTYAFEVPAHARKVEIKDAVEKIYSVRVVDVRTLNRPPKPRRFRFRMTEATRTKKAFVTLAKDSHIDLF